MDFDPRHLTPVPPGADLSAGFAVATQQAASNTVTLDKLVSWALTSLTAVVLAIVAFWASELQEQVHVLTTQVAGISDRTSRLEVKLDYVREKIDDVRRGQNP